MRPNKVIREFPVFIAVFALIALSCAGIADLPNPFVTETPISTNTLRPSPTFTATPSLTPTRTPTATPRPTGVVIEEQTDGTSLVVDYDNKHQVLLPPDWAIPFSSQEDLDQAIQQASEGDFEFAQVAETFKDVDPNIFRLVALNTDRNYVHTDFPALLTTNAYADLIASTMPMTFVTAIIEDTILEGASSTSWDVIDNANNVEVGLVRGTRTFDIPNTVGANVEELVISFQSNKKLIVIEIAVPREFGEQILSPFDNIIDSIKANID